VLMPVTRRPAFPLGSLDFAERFLNVAPCSAITLVGLPVVVVRVGSTSDGLPAGVQIIGRPFADHEVLAVARRLEEAFQP
jgi:amidase